MLNINRETNHNHLDLLFIKPSFCSMGIGYKAWLEIEKLYPNTIVWEAYTPYFETRNILFYVNKCGFQIVEFFCKFHKYLDNIDEYQDGDQMFRFIKK